MTLVKPIYKAILYGSYIAPFITGSGAHFEGVWRKRYRDRVHFFLASGVSDFTPTLYSNKIMFIKYPQHPWPQHGNNIGDWERYRWFQTPQYQKQQHLDDHRQVRLFRLFGEAFLLVDSVFVEICTLYQSYERCTTLPKPNIAPENSLPTIHFQIAILVLGRVQESTQIKALMLYHP